MKKRNQPNIHIVDLNVNEKNTETLFHPKDIFSREIRKKKIGRLYRPMCSSSSEIYKKVGEMYKSTDVSSPEIRPEILRSNSAGGESRVSGMPRAIKNSFLTPKTPPQTLFFLPSICYPVNITSQSHRNQEDEKRSKSESKLRKGPTKVGTPDCSTLQERKRSLIDRQCDKLDIKKNIESLTERPDLTGLFKRRKSNTVSVTQTEIVKRRSSLKENKEESETVYAVYDSSTSSPRLVRVKHDTNRTSTQIPDKIENVIDTDGGFQDIDLSLDPSTLNLSWDDHDFHEIK